MAGTSTKSITAEEFLPFARRCGETLPPTSCEDLHFHFHFHIGQAPWRLVDRIGCVNGVLYILDV